MPISSCSFTLLQLIHQSNTDHNVSFRLTMRHGPSGRDIHRRITNAQLGKPDRSCFRAFPDAECGNHSVSPLPCYCIWSKLTPYSYYDGLFHKNGNRCGVQYASPQWPVKDQVTWTACQKYADEAIAPWLWALQTDRIVGKSPPAELIS